ncbi:MAG: carboxylesterase [Gammaproteobacteria bacterium]|nr:carboxylesterase [Gammaproteobacteria bacterium]
MASLDYLEKIHGDNPDAAIIWLHGLGADAYDFMPLVSQLNLPSELSIHFVFPHAPVQPVTINQGMSMPAWYDILELSLEAEEDHAGITSSMNAIESLIESKFTHIDPNRIILAGFSQGGALVLHTLLHGKAAIGGVIALSTYLPLRGLAPEANKGRVLGHDIFMAHGDYDEVLPIDVGDLARGVLLTLGTKITWRNYPMAHQLCDAQIQDIRKWVINKLTN